MSLPSLSAETHELARGVIALGGGVAWLPEARSVLVADAHLAYEDVVGAALPLWSTAEIARKVAAIAEAVNAREIVFLGDIVHGARMSEGAMRTVATALQSLRSRWTLTLVAGNHEGRTRAFQVLGHTVEACERDGWRLVHGDGPVLLGTRTIIGHLHPSVRLGGIATAPAFAASAGLVVVPALTPYSPGLDVLSHEFTDAIGRYAVKRDDMHVVVASGERVYPFGSLLALQSLIRAKAPPKGTRPGIRRRPLRSDA